MTPERLAQLRSKISTWETEAALELDELLDEVERLTAERDEARRLAEMWRPYRALNKFPWEAAR